MEHLRTILWLRWTLTKNQIQRQGQWWAIIVSVIFVLTLCLAALSFFLAFGLGVSASARLSATHWMYVWDILALLFCGAWTLGLLIELQHSEMLSPQKLLHLPVSLRGLYLCNYVSSLISLSLALAVPIGAGLSGAMIYAGGFAALGIPLVFASGVLMVTALTYQLQGWLAALMVNPRRRRTIIASVIMFVVVGAQLPNLVNVYVQRSLRNARQGQSTEADFTAKFNERIAAGEARPEQYVDELRRFQQQQTRERDAKMDALAVIWHQRVVLANQIVPIGWTAYAVRRALEGAPLPSLLVILAQAAIGLWSLRRGYQSMLRFSTGGHSTAGSNATSGVPSRDGEAGAVVATRRGKNWLENRWPGVSDRAAAVAWLTLRCLSRSPEARLLMLGPVIGLLVGGSFLAMVDLSQIPAAAKPFIVLGAAGFTLMMLTQMLQNQFGQDRSGFRALVLSGAPRADILLGKNLAFAILIAVLAGGSLLVVQLLLRLPVWEFVAVLLQLVGTAMGAVLGGNFMSIWFPIAITPGSAKPASANSKVILAHMLYSFLFPVLFLPFLLCFGADYLVAKWLGWQPPVFLVLTVPVLVAHWAVYRRVLVWQGALLQRREQTMVAALRTESE